MKDDKCSELKKRLGRYSRVLQIFHKIHDLLDEAVELSDLNYDPWIINARRSINNMMRLTEEEVKSILYDMLQSECIIVKGEKQ